MARAGKGILEPLSLVDCVILHVGVHAKSEFQPYTTQRIRLSLSRVFFNAKRPLERCKRQALMGALAEDQKAIEGILEGERIRMEESFRSATAARKARDKKHAEEDAAEER